MTFNSNNMWLETYDRFAAKLLHFCRARFPASAQFNPAVILSGKDLAQGRAVLCLTKHFGRFPCEIGEFDEKTDLSEVELFLQRSGTPVLVQTVPILDSESGAIPGYEPISSFENSKADIPGNVQVHLPPAGWRKDSPQHMSAQYLFSQIGEISRYLLERHNQHGCGFVHVAGFNFLPSPLDGESIPAAEFLPWYCLLCDESGAHRVYRQPELGKIFAGLPVENPKAINLEELVAKMEEEEPKDL